MRPASPCFDSSPYCRVPPVLAQSSETTRVYSVVWKALDKCLKLSSLAVQTWSLDNLKDFERTQKRRTEANMTQRSNSSIDLQTGPGAHDARKNGVNTVTEVWAQAVQSIFALCVANMLLFVPLLTCLVHLCLAEELDEEALCKLADAKISFSYSTTDDAEEWCHFWNP